MSPEEAFRLCRLAKAGSPAQAIDEYTPEVWALVLERWPYADGEQALVTLFAEQEWVHVSHVVKQIRRLRRKRLEDFGVLPDPPRELDPSDTVAYHAWMVATSKKIADGNPPPPRAIAGQHRDVIATYGHIGRDVNE